MDNGMGLDEGQEGQGRSTADSDQTGQGRSTADSDQTGQGLQWGAASAAPITISPTKKKVNTGKAVKEAQVRLGTLSVSPPPHPQTAPPSC